MFKKISAAIICPRLRIFLLASTKAGLRTLFALCTPSYETVIEGIYCINKRKGRLKSAQISELSCISEMLNLSTLNCKVRYYSSENARTQQSGVGTPSI